MTTKTDTIPQPFDSDSDALAWLHQLLVMEEPLFQLSASYDTWPNHRVPMISLRLTDAHRGGSINAFGETLLIALAWLRNALKQDLEFRAKRAETFSEWWVAEKGRPPIDGEEAEFNTAKAAWEAARA